MKKVLDSYLKLSAKDFDEQLRKTLKDVSLYLTAEQNERIDKITHGLNMEEDSNTYFAQSAHLMPLVRELLAETPF